MSRIRTAFLAVALAAAPAAASAGPTACPAHFAPWGAPVLAKPGLERAARELCFSGFAVLHSGLTRTPLWSAEHLTRDRVAMARQMERDNTFHPEAALPASERAEISDYARSGFDRGHMAPSGDMPDAASQGESFTLANMVPQSPDNNRGLWADIEKAVRGLSERKGEAFVVTGPVFQGDTVGSLKGRVLVPTNIYKAVYVPSTGEAGAYVVQNAPGRKVAVVSLDRLREITGIDAFPGLAPGARASAARLPLPSGASVTDDATRPLAEGGGQASPQGERHGGAHAGAWHQGWAVKLAIALAIALLGYYLRNHFRMRHGVRRYW